MSVLLATVLAFIALVVGIILFGNMCREADKNSPEQVFAGLGAAVLGLLLLGLILSTLEVLGLVHIYADHWSRTVDDKSPQRAPLVKPHSKIEPIPDAKATSNAIQKQKSYLE